MMTATLASRAGHSADGLRPAGGTAATMLGIYLVLLLAVPSSVTIGSLASLGRPSFLMGLLLAFWWVLAQLQRPVPALVRVPQPVRYAFLAFVVVVLVSFALAMLRGQPADQVSPAFTAILRVFSWGGVLLVAMDGIRTREEVITLLRRLSIGAGLVAAFGLTQFLTGTSLLDWVGNLPGITYDSWGLIGRGTFTRVTATAQHPLEYAVVVTGCLPLAMITAMSDGFRPSVERRVRIRWWLPVVLMTAASLVSVSRSAVIGLAIAVIATLPAMTRPYRWIVTVGGTVMTMAVAVVVPGIATTMIALFLGGTNEPSAQSRSNGLERLPEFLATSPFVGAGFGTFLPRYYIFDDQWALLTVETGVLGVLAFGSIVISAIGSGIWSSQVSADRELIIVGRGIAASLLTVAVLFAFFDALSFPMAAGILFLLSGLTGSLRAISVSSAVPPVEARHVVR